MKSVGQVILGIFMSILILGVLGLAGYGTYALVDTYILDKPVSTTPAENSEKEMSAEQVLANIAVEDFIK